MRRTSLWILALSLVVGACDSESGPSVAKLEDMRVVKVSGDQSSPVPSAPSATIYATAGASLDVIGADGYTPEPLVARVEVDGAASRGVTSGGAVIPKGTLVHWKIPSEAGRLLGTPTATDDTAYVINRWAPGTKAGAYRVIGQIILEDGSIKTGAEWEMVVEPGAPHNVVGWQVPARYPVRGTDLPRVHCESCITILEIGDTIDFREWWRDTGPWVEDEHGNEIDLAVILSEYAPNVRAVNGAFVADGEEATILDIDGSGWTMVVPNEPGFWSMAVRIGPAMAINFVEFRTTP